MAIVDSVRTLLCYVPRSFGRSFLDNTHRLHCQKQAKRNYFQRLCALTSVMLLLLGGVAFGDFPPVLVSGWGSGTMCSRIKVSGTDYAVYSADWGVFILHGENGGDAAWGDDETEALNNPRAIGTWYNDYSQSSYISGLGEAPSFCFALPQVLLYYSSSIQAPTLRGYDGQQQQAIGSGEISGTAGNFVAAYNGLPNGYIFSFDGTSPIYRYNAGDPSKPTQILATNGVYPPSNVAILSSTINFNNITLTKTSFTDGIGNGYWSHTYYQGNNSSGTVYGDLHVCINGDGSIGKMWGTVGDTTVTAQWDPTTKMFIADQTLGTTSLITSPSTPQYGPPQVEVNGKILPFRYLDAQNNDVYCDPTGQTWVAISGSNMVTVCDAYTTVTGTYDRTGQSFSPELGDCAAVSADGTTLLGLPDGLWVYTTGWVPGTIHYTDGMPLASDPNYSLYRSDGTALFKYVRVTDSWGDTYSRWYDGELFHLSGSPLYRYSRNLVLDAINGWPDSSVAPPFGFSSVAYINGSVVNLNGSGWFLSDDFGFVYSFNYSGPGGSMSGWVAGNENNADMHYFYLSAANGDECWSNWIGVSNGSFSVIGYSGNTINVTFGPMPDVAPQGYPSQIDWNGTVYPYSSSGGGYTNPNGNLQIVINGSTVTVSGTHAITGIYNPDTFQFNFNGDPAMKTFVAQDANGNLLGTPVGLSLYFSGTQGGFGQSIKLGDGTLLSSSNTTVYNFRQADGTLGVKYLGIPQGSLFVVADASGYYTSPVYRYSSSGGDFVLKTGSNGAWAASNLYPRQLYVNGHYASIDATTQNSWITPIYGPNSGNAVGQEFGGQVAYRVQPGGQVFTIAWTWGAPYGWIYDATSNSWNWSNATHGFSATISGNYNQFANVNGLWDGGQIFSGLPSGLVISVAPPSLTAQYGPPQIKWNGVELVYNPQSSVTTSTNPQGANVYTDTLGLGMLAMVGKDGSVTLYGADGSQYAGTYDPNSYQFAFTGQSPGTIQADSTQGFVLHSSSGRNDNDNTATSDATMEALGNFDVQGNSFSLGNWVLSGTSMPGLILSYANSQPSVVQFAGARRLTKWVWSHAHSDGSTTQEVTMQVDGGNRLKLYDPAAQSTGTTAVQPTIIWDPSASGTSQVKGVILIQPKGDLEMGSYTNGPAPQ